MLKYETLRQRCFIQPNAVHPTVRDQVARESECFNADALLGEGVYIASAGRMMARQVGARSLISAGAFIDEAVIIGTDVKVGDHAEILWGAFIGDGVRIGNYATVGSGAVVNEGVVFPGLGRCRSNGSYASTIRQNSVLAGNLVMPKEFQVGPDAVIPGRECIATIGRFGVHKRMVTIYGGIDGQPLFGVGCQFGITESEFLNRVNESTETVPASTQDYLRNWARISEIAAEIQRAFELRRTQADDLLAESKVTRKNSGLVID